MSEISEIYESHLDQWSDIQDHLTFMHDVVIEDWASTVVELGVRSGVSTSAFLAALEHLDSTSYDEGRPEFQLWSIDVNRPPLMPAFYRSGLWTFVQGDDLQCRDCVPEKIDVLFIDTLHHKAHTLAELRLYGSGSKIILMHDTDLEHPHRAPRGDPAFPVRAAISEWLRDNPQRTVTYREDSYGLGVIR